MQNDDCRMNHSKHNAVKNIYIDLIALIAHHVQNHAPQCVPIGCLVIHS